MHLCTRCMEAFSLNLTLQCCTAHWCHSAFMCMCKHAKMCTHMFDTSKSLSHSLLSPALLAAMCQCIAHAATAWQCTRNIRWAVSRDATTSMMFEQFKSGRARTQSAGHDALFGSHSETHRERQTQRAARAHGNSHRAMQKVCRVMIEIKHRKTPKKKKKTKKHEQRQSNQTQHAKKKKSLMSKR